MPIAPKRPADIELNVKLYSKEAADILTNFIIGIDRTHELARNAWRMAGCTYCRKPARPILYSTYEKATLSLAGDMRITPRKYSRSMWRFNEQGSRKVSTTLGWAMLHALPKNVLSDVKLRAALPVADYFNAGMVDGAKAACLAELLIGRDPKRLRKAYGAIVDELIGKPSNALVVQRRVTLANEIDRLTQECQACCDDLDAKYKEALNAVEAAFKKKTEETKEEFQKKIDELNAQLTALEAK